MRDARELSSRMTARVPIFSTMAAFDARRVVEHFWRRSRAGHRPVRGSARSDVWQVRFTPRSSSGAAYRLSRDRGALWSIRAPIRMLVSRTGRTGRVSRSIVDQAENLPLRPLRASALLDLANAVMVENAWRRHGLATQAARRDRAFLPPMRPRNMRTCPVGLFAGWERFLWSWTTPAAKLHVVYASPIPKRRCGRRHARDGAVRTLILVGSTGQVPGPPPLCCGPMPPNLTRIIAHRGHGPSVTPGAALRLPDRPKIVRSKPA